MPAFPRCRSAAASFPRGAFAVTTLPVMATLDAAGGATAVGDFAMVVR